MVRLILKPHGAAYHQLINDNDDDDDHHDHVGVLMMNLYDHQVDAFLFSL